MTSTAVVVVAHMRLLLQALDLFANVENQSALQFRELMELRDQARGEEAAQIGKVVEAFIKQAPPDLVMEISKVTLGF